MKTEDRKEIIDYILKHELSHAKSELEKLSYSKLAMMKINISIEKSAKKKKEIISLSAERLA